MSNYPRIFAVTPRKRINAVTPRLKNFPVTIPAGGNPIPHGRCFNFNGANQYVNIGALNTDIIADGKFSISIRAKSDEIIGSSDNALFGYYINATNYFYVKYPATGFNACSVRSRYNGVNGYGDTFQVLSSPLEFTNLIFVFDTTSWKVYVNNVKTVDEVDIDSSTSVGVPLWYIGNNSLLSGNHFDGQQFDSQFFNKALTPNEVDYITTFGESGVDPGIPMAGYRMNDTDNTMRDWTGNGNNGIIVNSDPAFYAFQNIHDYGSAP